MHKVSGKERLIQLKKQWLFKALLSNMLTALAITLFITISLHKFLSLSIFWFLPILLILLIVATLFTKSRKLNEWDVSRFLNVTNPSLEESAQLVLKPETSLSFLERLQARKVEAELLTLKAPDPYKKQFTASLILLAITVIVSVALLKIPIKTTNGNSSVLTNSSINSTPEIVLLEIRNASITITPPAYTRKTVRQQVRFNLLAEEGAKVSWSLQTTVTAKDVKLIFNDGTTLPLAPDAKHLNWRTQRVIRTSGFYQVKLDDKLSELYRIEAIKDQKPNITIQSPKPTTTIEYPEPERVMLRANLADDYGISAAYISATVSSGQGEAVKFKEQKLSFENFPAGGKDYHLQKLIDCKSLGMQQGDELYFFISATDNHNQENRSDVYIITLKDTTDMMSMDGLVTALDIKPELFRSERQIIIETEQLLKDKATISVEEFKKKSNDLGTDQKLLRLRYGKFLGEETDNEIGAEHDDHHEHENKTGSDNTSEILDQYTHKHDNAEDATFFDAATKKQLKATLNEMWNAELKLRTFLPKEALPFEYKALRLLKDLQQKSRAYVPKTGFKSTPLKLDKRLTGDLSKITQPTSQQSIPRQDALTIATRKSLGILEQLKNTAELNASSREVLQQAFQQLSSRAANQPGVYLAALASLRKVLNETYRIKDIKNAEQGLQKMSANVERLPYPAGTDNMQLSKQYFINLNKGNRQ
jgi:hypothetical protein